MIHTTIAIHNQKLLSCLGNNKLQRKLMHCQIPQIQQQHMVMPGHYQVPVTGKELHTEMVEDSGKEAKDNDKIRDSAAHSRARKQNGKRKLKDLEG
ncbi:hypothetical protein L2E82_37295 [Cichorium intybus]|uniref:Uncharacterized protein n=1 Tax=Cichorium intybus TaxID=13427 RepID=A0ACB9AEN0_CICIN|nr:hypothetical protein L2E82_37295 [Cichorium intybus]